MRENDVLQEKSRQLCATRQGCLLIHTGGVLSHGGPAPDCGRGRLGGGATGGAVGHAFRGISTAVAFVVVAAGVQVGKSGGELVYRHGAASAYSGTQADLAKAPADHDQE